jgi:hypothetical protein
LASFQADNSELLLIAIERSSQPRHEPIRAGTHVFLNPIPSIFLFHTIATGVKSRSATAVSESIMQYMGEYPAMNGRDAGKLIFSLLLLF